MPLVRFFPPRTAAIAGAVLAFTVAPAARASNGLESPSTGVEQMARGGAWLARADNGMAAYYNPAALATQAHNVHLGGQMLFRSHCFQRRDADGTPVSPGSGLKAPTGEVCGDYDFIPLPQLAATFRLHKRVALGLALVAPHGSATASWPVTIDYENNFQAVVPHPSPQRYLLLESSAFALFPTLSIGINITKQLQLGAGFSWGFAGLEFANMTETVSGPRPAGQPDDFTKDIRTRIDGFDGFIPGGVFSLQYSPIRQLDIAAYYRVSDAIRTKVNLYAQSGYYNTNGQVNEQHINDPANITDVKDAGDFVFPIPMEAKLGFRYRQPRRGARGQQWLSRHRGWARDSITEDLFDIELDLTWANNAMVDTIQVRLKPNIPIQGTPGFAPENADQPRMWKHVFGVRLGGEWVPIPDLLALRMGGFFESKGVADSHLSLDFHQAEKGGIAGGAKLRLGRVDISLAYQHTFFGTLDNGGQGAINAVSGDKTSNNRSRQFVNGGSSSMSLNELGISSTIRF